MRPILSLGALLLLLLAALCLLATPASADTPEDPLTTALVMDSDGNPLHVCGCGSRKFDCAKTVSFLYSETYSIKCTNGRFACLPRGFGAESINRDSFEVLAIEGRSERSILQRGICGISSDWFQHPGELQVKFVCRNSFARCTALHNLQAYCTDSWEKCQQIQA